MSARPREIDRHIGYLLDEIEQKMLSVSRLKAFQEDISRENREHMNSGGVETKFGYSIGNPLK